MSAPLGLVCRGRAWGGRPLGTAAGGLLGEGEDLVEARDEALLEDLEVRDRAGVGVDAEGAGVDVGQQRHVDAGADGRAEGVLHPDGGATEPDRHGDAGDVAGEEVDVPEDGADVPPGQEVEPARNGLGVREGPLALRGGRPLVDEPDPLLGIGHADRHREAHQRDAVAADRVVVVADADRHRHPEVTDLGAVVLVVAAQAAGDAGDERVVEGAAGHVRGVLERGERHLVHTELAHHPAALHDRRRRLVDGLDGPVDRGGRREARLQRPARVADPVHQHRRHGPRGATHQLADQGGVVRHGVAQAAERTGRRPPPAPPGADRGHAASR